VFRIGQREQQEQTMQQDRFSSLADELKQSAARDTLRTAVRVDISHRQPKAANTVIPGDRIAEREMQDAERWDGMS
jgi:hypothetical protein